MSLSTIEALGVNFLIGLITTITGTWLYMEKYFVSTIVTAITGILFIIGFNIYRTRRQNNHKYFQELNKEFLIKHINLLIDNPKWAFNRLLRRITLYRGFDDRPYVFVVEIPDTILTKDISVFEALINHWTHASLRDCVDDSFRKEVYRKESDADADPSLAKWFVLTTEPNEKVSTEVAQKKYRWVLYKKQ